MYSVAKINSLATDCITIAVMHVSYAVFSQSCRVAAILILYKCHGATSLCKFYIVPNLQKVDYPIICT